ncbi:formamidopyrimidine-DNA glycosylase [Gregarina niphandrodes]|uniref:Formamidopyrimidine-DNA glycosylase n=1 Tax=Gregarina niphandrodes TaxID=110365 RepID=A0A023AX43_GRENI|nr:formamidopyrimidine-DNA glycosylase [Gregarina niphandrodes]EZG43167.1 formamidopyrimidine-DNA glycosylase [Gregarina niphandrodes]|eukprot:XP_011133574.1 formamidopyrimidine-DNA glycosylase [Gregarina niphandrodes]
MPELPEVETTRRQISEEFILARRGGSSAPTASTSAPAAASESGDLQREVFVSEGFEPGDLDSETGAGPVLRSVECVCASLRSAVPSDLDTELAGSRLVRVLRRGKYLVLIFRRAQADRDPPPPLLVHLGMSGWMCAYVADKKLPKHSHVVFNWSDRRRLVYNDARRFGTVDWCRSKKSSKQTTHQWQTDFRLRHLGPEPFSMGPEPFSMGPEPFSVPVNALPSADALPSDDAPVAFTVDYMCERARGKRVAVKKFLMDSRVVVGVGNIYAAEALFAARLRPDTRVCDLSRSHWEIIVQSVRDVLTRAIAAKGTTFRDFKSGQGEPGYFLGNLQVYGRAGKGCLRCDRPLTNLKLGGRQTVCCLACQRLILPPNADDEPTTTTTSEGDNNDDDND